MRTHGGLFARLVDRDHLEHAARFTMRGKRRRPDVAWCLFTLHDELTILERQLRARCYRPEPIDLLHVRDPKPRVIARAPMRDRILHAAAGLLLEPVLERHVSDDTFACRRAFGTHRARLRLLEFMRRFRYALHLDIRSYFPSIAPGIVSRLLRGRVRDERFLEVMNIILEEGRGLYDSDGVRALARIDRDWPRKGIGIPIGSFTSQLIAAHLYLCELDHLVRRAWHVPGYVRYVDDLFLFARRRNHLEATRARIIEYLIEQRELRLKAPRAPVLHTSCSLKALGVIVTRQGIAPLSERWRTVRKRIASHVRGGNASAMTLRSSFEQLGLSGPIV